MLSRDGFGKIVNKCNKNFVSISKDAIWKFKNTLYIQEMIKSILIGMTDLDICKQL